MIADSTEPWVTGQLALALLAVDPAGLGGVVLRARAGPVRDACLGALPEALGPVRRIAPGIADDQLYSGIDLAATLATGRVVRSAGLLARPATLMLCMAERCPAGLAARLGQTLDTRAGHALIMLDEGAEPDEHAPHALAERVAFRIDLDGRRAADMATLTLGEAQFDTARRRLDAVSLPDEALVALTVTAARLGIHSARAPLMAVACARANAALMGRAAVGEDDLQIAVQLVYAHRATMIPAEEEDSPSEPQQDSEPDDQPQSDDTGPSPEALADILVAAAHAVLPPGIEAALAASKASAVSKGAGGAGGRRITRQRGRPLPARPGRISAAARIDLITTLRSAAPWQPIRRRAAPERAGLIIRPEDIHIRRFEERSDRVVIFVVDASGSAAMARLAEAKGAVELMLADAYARRDQVALIAFRGDGADLMLPPTRSLVQTKRRLAGLPGGGGTPLAAGLMAGHDLATRVRRQGATPALAVLTDGRANVPLPPRSGRAAAAEDADRAARLIAMDRTPAALVDTGNRPTPALALLAARMGGQYIALPRADAHGLTRAVGTALA
jgi:magnesium chelatase subunit D